MNLTPMQIDAQSREKIIKEIASNFFVEAGAGSGKTTILVKRMVAMVEAGVDVSKICAITFTKAAAGEFYARFQKKLIERSTQTQKDSEIDNDLPVPTDESRSRCLAALNDIDLCFMGTIDAFCNMILSEHPAKAGIPSNASVLSFDEITAVYRKEYSAIQRGHYGEELKQLCNRFRLFHSKPDGVFVGSIGTMMDTRNCKHFFTAPSGKDVDEVFKNEKASVLSFLRSLLNNSHLAYENYAASADAWETLKTKEQLLFGSWNNNFSGVLAALKGLARIRLTADADPSKLCIEAQAFLEPHLSRNKLAWYELSESGIPLLCQKLRDLQYAVTMEFLEKASAVIADSLRKKGQLTYFDYLMYLRDLLRDDAKNGGKLIAHIYDRHSYFLIDEFQDTNPMQAEIFFYLAAKNPVPDWKNCIPQSGSLFIVGDPKQSIYRFRYADVASFLRVKEMFKGEVGEVLYLTRNFRSTYKIRSWFNDTFQALLPDNTDIQSRFEPIPLEDNPKKDDSFSGVFSYNVSGARGALKKEKDPETVARIIRRMVGNPAYLINENGEKRTVSYKDIMLITPRKSKLREYMQVFSAYNIPFRVEGSVSFSECPSLITVSKLFTLAANPTDTAALVAALTCGRYQISLQEIYALKKQGHPLSLYAEPDDSITMSDTLREAMESLKRLADRSHYMSASALFVWILNVFQVYRYVSTHNLPDLYFALELLRNAESNGRFATLNQAALFLEGLIQNESDAERTLSLTRNENRVHLANLHKVKGLEAPIVILGDPTALNRKPEIRVAYNDTEPKCHIFEISQNLNTYLAFSGFDAEKEAEQACLDGERCRLLYVAATRARRVLLVANETKSDGTASDSNLWKFFVDRAEGDFFASLPVGKEKTTPQKQELRAEALYKKGEEENLLHQSNSFKASYEIRRPSQIKLKGKSASEDNFEDEASTEVRSSTLRQNAALIGTMVHSLMEAMVSSRAQADVSTLIEEIVGEYDANTGDYRMLLTSVANTILTGGYDQKTDVPKDILQTLLSADEVYCEMPFCRNITENGKTILWHGIMDVVYRIGDSWYIIDYKTNADDVGLDEKYEEQLTAYCEAFFALTGNTAQAMIYHIDV